MVSFTDAPYQVQRRHNEIYSDSIPAKVVKGCSYQQKPPFDFQIDFGCIVHFSSALRGPQKRILQCLPWIKSAKMKGWDAGSFHATPAQRSMRRAFLRNRDSFTTFSPRFLPICSLKSRFPKFESNPKVRRGLEQSHPTPL